MRGKEESSSPDLVLLKTPEAVAMDSGSVGPICLPPSPSALSPQAEAVLDEEVGETKQKLLFIYFKRFRVAAAANTTTTCPVGAGGRSSGNRGIDGSEYSSNSSSNSMAPATTTAATSLSNSTTSHVIRKRGRGRPITETRKTKTSRS